MKVPEPLSKFFDENFEKSLSTFVPESLKSTRYLNRSIAPHIQRLSDLFNRISKNFSELKNEETPVGLSPYWKMSSNPSHLRLAYFLYFMPQNLFRVASIWSELSRLGLQSPPLSQFKMLDFGAGPASASCGIFLGEHFSPIGIPKTGYCALIEQDPGLLKLGTDWVKKFQQGFAFDFEIRSFKRKIDFSEPLLPGGAPSFHLWILSFFLNETAESPQHLAKILVHAWDKHLEQEGLVIIVEPALKMESRRLLELRKALLTYKNYQILLPCLGHQSCGALENPEDWCHEEASWWRPPYFRHLDKQLGFDHKSLAFSYLVLIKSDRPREEILTELKGADFEKRLRLVSPAREIGGGGNAEFYVCGKTGKHKARARMGDLQRGDILKEAEWVSEAEFLRIKKYLKVTDRA